MRRAGGEAGIACGVALAAGVVAFAPTPAAAAMSDLFPTGRGLDAALELEYRSHYLTADHVARDEPPPDRYGRERLDDAKARVAREQVRLLQDRFVGEVLDSLPHLAELERRLEALTTFRLGGRAGAAGSRAPAGEDDPAAGGWLRRAAAAPAPAEAGALTVRLRIGTGLDRVAPAVEVARGPLRGRLAFDAARERLELLLVHPLWKSATLEAAGTGGPGGAAQLRLTVSVPF